MLNNILNCMVLRVLANIERVAYYRNEALYWKYQLH